MGFASGGDNAAFTATLTDPFPATWERHTVTRYLRLERIVKLPGSTSGGQVNTEVFSDQASVGQVREQLHTRPPKNLRVANALAVDRVWPPTPAAQRLTWDAAVGASRYRVKLTRLSLTGSRTRLALVATFETATTSLDLPRTLLDDGDRYLIVVTAIGSDVAFSAGALRDRSLPEYGADAISGVLYFSSTCGDGHVDPGETCDDGGAQTSCDYDCTNIECRDGIANTIAGEACDPSVNGPVKCDADCTPVACHDGVVNREAGEFCDTNPDTTDDGCNTGCQLDFITCGDGVVQAPGEQCDDSNQVDEDICRNDCQWAECGDGRLTNAPADNYVEECDDSNSVDGDGCSATCTVEP